MPRSYAKPNQWLKWGELSPSQSYAIHRGFCGERLSTNEGGGCSGPKSKETLRLPFCQADALSHSSTKFAVTIRVELANSGVDVYWIWLCGAGSGGRKACYYAEGMPTCSGLANSGSCALLSINYTGARTCHCCKPWAHQSYHYSSGSTAAEFQGSCSRSFCTWPAASAPLALQCPWPAGWFPFLLQDMPVMKFFVPSFSELWRQVFFFLLQFQWVTNPVESLFSLWPSPDEDINDWNTDRAMSWNADPPSSS